MTNELSTRIDALATKGKEIVIARMMQQDYKEQQKLRETMAIEDDLLDKVLEHLNAAPLTHYYSLRQEWDIQPKTPMVQSGNNLYLWVTVPDLAPILVCLQIWLEQSGHDATRYRPGAWDTQWTIQRIELMYYSACDTWDQDEEMADQYWWKRAPGHNCDTIEEAVYWAKKEFGRYLEKELT